MKISILITHYNRPKELLLCIEAIKRLNIPNSEIVVSDDASKKENIEIIQQYKVDQLLLSDVNQGLAEKLIGV